MITPTKTALSALAKVLSAEYETVDEAAEAAMAEAWAQYEARAKFVIAGQLKYGPEGYFDPEDARASKVVVGPFATETQARAAGQQLGAGKGGEEFRWWCVSAWHGTPAAYFKARTDERKRIEEKANSKSEITLELDRRQRWFREHPDALTYEPDPQPLWDAAVVSKGWVDPADRAIEELKGWREKLGRLVRTAPKLKYQNGTDVWAVPIDEIEALFKAMDFETEEVE